MPAILRSLTSRAAPAVAIALVAGCGGDGRTQPAASPAASAERGEPDPGASASERRTGTSAARRQVALGRRARVQTVATGLSVPWEIAFLPDGRALVTERPGRVRVLSRRGRLLPRPLARVDVAATGEGGLLGLAVDPGFRRNRLLYIYRTREGGNEVLRYRLDGDRLVQQAVVVDGIAASAIHDGGRLRFGPDGALYASTGDAAQPDLAQRPGSLNGKILRIPAAAARTGRRIRPEIHSLGHRNPQGFDWDPRTGRLVADEHGPAGYDEVNLIVRGANYGWPLVTGGRRRRGLRAPIAVYGRSIAPSGATFVRRRGSRWTGDYLIACLVGRQIRRVRIRDGRVVLDQALFHERFGRLRTVVEGPDGALYVLTNNRDGRGSPRPGDDRILRIAPPAR